MRSPLEDVRVLELTTMITGPLAGMLLSDFGASVIKIENREGGDPFRNHHGGLYGGHFLSYNRNKRSLTLDLRSAKGKDIFFSLIAKSDVLIDNFRPGVLDRLGFGWETLKNRNSRLIHASITGFGADGPYRDRPSYDAVSQALSGVLSQFVDPSAPQPGGPTLADNITGFYAANAILAALYERERTNKGCRIETSMLEAMIAFASDGFINYRRHHMDIGPLSRVSTSQSYVFRCQDGKCVALHLSSQTKFWEGLLEAVGRKDLATHPDFAQRENRIKNYKRLRDELAETFLTRPRSEWTARLEAADVPHAPVYNIPEVFDDPQVQHLRTFYRVQHPTEGEVWGVEPPMLFDEQRPGKMTAPPMIGEHTDLILAELGYSADSIKSLKSEKVV
jgi:crotonobetainyl-CoA:carnitine CoA-transferase CaiB-like acyl-CoA transferase